MRKLTLGLIIVLAAVMIGKQSLFPSESLPQNTESLRYGDWRYTIEEDAVTLVEYSGKAKILDIPEFINELPVKALGDKLFRNNYQLTEVAIPDSVATLGTAVFRGCFGLEKVKLPAGLTRIPNEAFFFCSSLETIDLPASVASIGAYAFQNCGSLQSVVLPDAVTSLGSKAFANCAKLQNITVSKNLRSLGSGAFSETPWLDARDEEFVIVGNRILIKYNGTARDVEIPVPVSSIVDAFDGNRVLRRVILPKTLTFIGERAFSDCIDLREINIPSGVTSIGGSAFSGCINLQPPVLPEKLVSIGSSAFQNCLSFDEIEIPEKVKTIGSKAFAECSGLKKVILPLKVERIAEDAFENSPEIKLQVGLGTFGETFAINHHISYSFLLEKNQDYTFQRSAKGIELFSYIGKIFDVIVPETIDGQPVWKIGAGAFQRNSLVRSVVIPSSVREIGDYSFSYMENLEKVTIADGLEKIGKEAFSNNIRLRDFTIQAMNPEVGEDVFKNCPNVEITAPDGSTIAAKAEQQGIAPAGAAEIPPGYSFSAEGEELIISGDSGTDADPILPPEYTAEKTEEGWVVTSYSGTDTAIRLPVEISGQQVRGIGESAFTGKALTEISIPDGYVRIEKLAFSNMPEKVVITIPGSVTDIAENAFEGSQVIIRSYVGTAAEQFARDHEIQFRVIVYQ